MPQNNKETKSLPSVRQSRAARAAVEFSDEAIALYVAECYAGTLHYVNMTGQWFYFDNVRHRVEITLRVTDLIREVCREKALQARSMRKFGLAMEIASARKVSAVERLVRADRKIAATIDQFDRDRLLLNTPGKTIDFRTGRSRPNRAEDFITKQTAVAPNNDGCPLWLAFLERVVPDAQTRRYLQMAAGYSTTGLTNEHAMFFLYGTGANGKSVFLNTLIGVMGDYAVTAPMETFTSSQNDRHPTELARLVGARLVVANETEEGRRWAENRIKAVTAGDRVAARLMRRDFFEFDPEFKLWVAGNHKPGLRGVDEGIRRRMNLIPFIVTIPAEERDEQLFEKLKGEWPGILQWMIEGAFDELGEGLTAPEVVRRATDDYLNEEDSLGQWLGECCKCGDNFYSSSTELYRSWRSYAEKAGEFIRSQKRFSAALRDRGFIPRRAGGTGRAGFIGISIVTPEPETPEEGTQS